MARCSRIQNPIGQLLTFTKISTRKFVITRHVCHRCIHLLVTIIFAVVACTITFFIRMYFLSQFLIIFWCLWTFLIRLSSDLHLKHFRGVCSVYLFSEAPAARAFSFYCLIPLKNSSEERLAPPEKVYFFWTVLLRRIGPLVGTLMFKTLLLINELTCLLGNVIWLVVLCCLSVVCPRSVRTCDSIGGNGLCVRFPPCACARPYFASYLTVTVKIRTLESIFPVLLAGSLVW